MSLLTDVQEYCDENNFTPDGAEVNADVVEYEYTEHTRWSIFTRTVFRRGDEYVAVEEETPATEYQEVDTPPEIYAVRPAEVTVTKYEKV